MKFRPAVPAALFAALTLAACGSDDAQPIAAKTRAEAKAPAPPTATVPEDQVVTEEDVPEPVVVEDSKGDFESSCDMVMPEDFMSDDYKFFANAKMRNTGNVGIVVKVTAVFDQTMGENVKLRKTYRLGVGKSKTGKLATGVTQGQVDQFQDSPDYFDNEACRVHVKITDTFGTPVDQGSDDSGEDTGDDAVETEPAVDDSGSSEAATLVDLMGDETVEALCAVNDLGGGGDSGYDDFKSGYDEDGDDSGPTAREVWDEFLTRC